MDTIHNDGIKNNKNLHGLYIIHYIHPCPSCPYIETSNILGHLGFEIKIRFHKQISPSNEKT